MKFRWSVTFDTADRFATKGTATVTSVSLPLNKTRDEGCKRDKVPEPEQLLRSDITVTSLWIRCLSQSQTQDCKHDTDGRGRVLCHTPEGQRRWLERLVYDCKRKPGIRQTASVCSIRLPALFFLLWNQITTAPLLGETISEPWDGGVITEVKGDDKLILSTRQACFISMKISCFHAEFKNDFALN